MSPPPNSIKPIQIYLKSIKISKGMDRIKEMTFKINDVIYTR